jgi:hypothetical protein
LTLKRLRCYLRERLLSQFTALPASFYSTESEDDMRVSFAILGLIAVLTAPAAVSEAAVPKLSQPTFVPVATPVVCVGNRLVYRNFADCRRRQGNSINYCSRICTGS